MAAKSKKTTKRPPPDPAARLKKENAALKTDNAVLLQRTAGDERTIADLRVALEQAREANRQLTEQGARDREELRVARREREQAVLELAEATAEAAKQHGKFKGARKAYGEVVDKLVDTLDNHV